MGPCVTNNYAVDGEYIVQVTVTDFCGNTCSQSNEDSCTPTPSCCPDPVPSTLTATFSNATGGAAVLNGVSVSLTFAVAPASVCTPGGFVQPNSWYGGFMVGADQWHMWFYCSNPGTSTWTLAFEQCGNLCSSSQNGAAAPDFVGNYTLGPPCSLGAGETCTVTVPGVCGVAPLPPCCAYILATDLFFDSALNINTCGTAKQLVFGVTYWTNWPVDASAYHLFKFVSPAAGTFSLSSPGGSPCGVSIGLAWTPYDLTTCPVVPTNFGGGFAAVAAGPGEVFYWLLYNPGSVPGCIKFLMS